MSETKRDSVAELHWQRRNNPKLVALNIAYGLFIDHSPAFAEDVPLDGFANAIQEALLDFRYMNFEGEAGAVRADAAKPPSSKATP